MPSAIFLDRDGTINVKAPEGEYVTEPRQLQLIPGAAMVIRQLNEAGVPVLVVTNQRAVALGRMTLDEVEVVHDALQVLLSNEGATVQRFYICPHAERTCQCRKPLPGLLLRAAADLPGVVLRSSIMIGDSETDVAAGLAAGATAVRLAATGTPTRAEWVAPDLAAAVREILARSERPTSC